MSAVSKILSRPPFRAQLFGLDLNGNGPINDLLPGTGWNENELGRGVDDVRLREIVERFNSSVAGGLTPAGRPLPPVTLPSSFRFGDSLFSQDLRVAKPIRFQERYELNVFGGGFNLFNWRILTATASTCWSARRSGDAGLRGRRAKGLSIGR